MPTTQSLPVKQSETKSLEKGSYKGIVFNIPGAEVNINGQWIAFDGKNRDAIMAQNPFSMKWRISGVLLRKLGYKQGDTMKGQFVTVDDKWSGLSFLTKEFTVTLE